jgi:hypothetical protein
MNENSITVEATEQIPTEILSTDINLNDTFIRKARAPFKGKKVDVSYELRLATLPELKEKESNQPYRSVNSGNEEEQVLSDLSGKTDVVLFDKLVVSTTGYGTNVAPGQSPEERAKSLKAIPTRHKAPVVQAVTKVTSEVIYDDEPEPGAFVWTEDQKFRVRTEVGDTGNIVVYFNVRELSQREMERYDGATKFFIEKGGKKPITKITVDVEPGVAIFDAIAESAENTITPLKDIPPSVKRSVVDAVVAGTKLDLGN